MLVSSVLPRFGSSEQNKDKDSQPTFYPNQPNRLVMGATEGLVHQLAKIAHISVRIDAEDQQKLDDVFGSGDSLILTPNHSTGLDAATVILMSRETGYRTAKMGAKEIFEKPVSVRFPVPPFPKVKTFKNRAWGKMLQWNNTFSVDRNTDASKTIETAASVLASGQSLFMFPQGHVNWKHHMALREEFKPGAANIAMMAVQQLEESGSDRQVKIVPIVFLFEPKGEPEKLDAALNKAVTYLEKFAHKKLKVEFSEGDKTIQERLELLFSHMVQEREKRYLAQYPELKLDQDSQDFYQRLDTLQGQIINTLEKRYGFSSNGSFERRARKLKAHISGLEERTKETKRDKVALHDILMGLSMYEKGYLNGDQGRQIEFMARLANDIKGTFYSMRRVVKFLRRAELEVQIVVGKPIHVSKAVKANPELDAEKQKALALELTGQVQRQIQGIMNKASAES